MNNLLSRSAAISCRRFSTGAAPNAAQRPKKSKTLKVVGGLLMTGVGGYAYRYNTDEGTRRSAEFWTVAAPIWAHYRTVQLFNRDLKVLPDEIADPYYDELHEKYTDRAKDITYKLRGFYLKNSQILSCQDGFVPPAYMNWMKDTQDNVPSEFKGTEAKEYCAKYMEDELGLKFDDVFESWDDEPIGVASIGEVHRARLRENGREVAVKLQFPDMERRFRADIKTIRDFCELAMPQHVSAFREIEKQFTTEFDYRGEADNLHDIRDKVMEAYGDYVEIPKPYMNLCSKHILVMDFLRGRKLVDGVRDYYRDVGKLIGKTLEEMEEERKADIAAGRFQFKSIEEDKRESARITQLMFLKDATNLTNIGRFIYNNLTPLPYIYPHTSSQSASSATGYLPYIRSNQVLNLGRLIEILCRVHGYEIFSLGIFNGDPHPGNILLLEDGRLGLIDYGQVKRMKVSERINLAKAMTAHLHYDKEEVARIYFDECMTKTKYSKRDIAYLHSAFWNDRDTDDVCNGMNITSFMDWCEAEDPMIQLPDEYLMAGRVSVLLRGMGNAFGLKLRMSEQWAPEVEAFLKEQNVDYVPPILLKKKTPAGSATSAVTDPAKK